MNTHTDPTATATDLAQLRERCAYCNDPMYIVVRAHHHTEHGVDVTRTVPRWLQRLSARDETSRITGGAY